MVVYALVIFFDNSYFIELNLRTPKDPNWEGISTREYLHLILRGWCGKQLIRDCWSSSCRTRLKGGISGVILTPCSAPSRVVSSSWTAVSIWPWQLWLLGSLITSWSYLSSLLFFPLWPLSWTPEKFTFKCFVVLIQIRFNSLIANGPSAYLAFPVARNRCLYTTFLAE